MILKRLTGGLLATNCYILGCEETGEAIVIDPGFREDECDKILGEVTANGLEVKYIANTHGHPDHTSCNNRLKKATSAVILLHESDAHLLSEPFGTFIETIASPLANSFVHHGDVIEVGKLKLVVIHTPGHSQGSISFYCESEKVVFTGDTLFNRSIGRTDLPGSSAEDMKRSLRDKLMKMPELTIVYPGHGPETTIGEEKWLNPFSPI